MVPEGLRFSSLDNFSVALAGPVQTGQDSSFFSLLTLFVRLWFRSILKGEDCRPDAFCRGPQPFGIASKYGPHLLLTFATPRKPFPLLSGIKATKVLQLHRNTIGVSESFTTCGAHYPSQAIQKLRERDHLEVLVVWKCRSITYVQIKCVNAG